MLNFRMIWMLLMVLGMHLTAAAQIDEFLPEIDTCYKMTSTVRLWLQAKETRAENGNPVTAEFGPVWTSI